MIHWTFEARSTGLQRRFPLDFRCALHWTFNFRCFDKGFVYKMFWHKNTIWGYKKGSKTKLENNKIFFDSLDFRRAFHWIFYFRCFDKDLCIKRSWYMSKYISGRELHTLDPFMTQISIPRVETCQLVKKSYTKK